MKDKIKFLSVLLTAIMVLSLASCVTVTKSPTGGSVTDDFDDLDLEDEEISTAIDDVESFADDAEDNEQDKEDTSADEGLPTKTVTEGELVSFPNLRATDPDGDPIKYTFSKPLDANGEWKTENGDAGKYKVKITASDGVNTVSQELLIVVLSSNKAPVIEGVKDVTVNEGDTVSLSPVVTDPEGEEVTVTYSGWMTSTSKATSYDDSGVYSVKIKATDGEKESEKTISVTVLNVNRLPSLSVADISVVEGDTVDVEAVTSDPDGDSVEVSFSEPVDGEGKWQTEVGDAGKYRVTATATDGTEDVTKSFFVIVASLNNAPVLSGVADMEADEGDVISLSVSAADEDGEDVTISYPSPFNAVGNWATGYEDAGIYTLKVTATDGIDTTEESFTVVVNDVNRAPSFGEGAFD